ncbi:RalBP1-associated Eps domain-containing protein 1 [Exaiptasia diaphana]|nr:RalBP1-associated Eps domain-containing protein 1 [Exaiptasia diaphana]
MYSHKFILLYNRPPSPSKSTSSIEEEQETSPWHILAEQYEYYTKQFRRLQPNDGGVIKGPKARDFFLKSNLSTEILSKVWHLSDINQDNALDLDEFCIAMHLVVAIRHGLDLPAVLPYELLHHRQVSNDLQAGRVSEESTETIEEDSKPLSKVRRNRSQSDTSLNEDHHPEIISRKTSMPVTRVDEEGRTQSPDQNVKIPRPKATNISLIDSRPGQLLPPPQPGQFPTWTPTKAGQDSDSAESDDDDSEKSSDDEDESRPLSPGQTVPPPPMPPLTEDETKEDEEEEEEGIPTPPSTPKDETPQPVFPDVAQVTRRLSKKSFDRPRSAGDVNDIVPLPSSDGSAESTPTNSSIGSDGKKEPPPPPPRRKEKGHSRSSSLDLNKLFGPKSKETRASTFGSPTSSQSSQTSQSGEVPLPLKTEPKPEQDDNDTQTTEDNQETNEKPAKEENFADFSNFETLVKAQGTASESHMNVPSQGRTHRRSLSLDHAQDYWPKTSQSNNIDSTIDDGSEERKLKTEPPKVVVKPLTKESKLQNSIRELKETNLLLSRLNSELQQENTEMMEQRISLELKLERLKPFTSK